MTEQVGRILTVGNFDGVHLGHRKVLGQLFDEGAKRGLRPTVLTFTDHPLNLIDASKAPARLMTSDERRAAIESIGGIDVLQLPFDDNFRRLTASQFVEMMRDNYNVRALLLGFNNSLGSDKMRGADLQKALGKDIGVEIVLAHEPIAVGGEGERHISSSLIRDEIARGNVAGAGRMLGQSYRLKGKVVHGRQLGRTIGFPTANIQPCHADKLIPGDGVYACKIEVEGMPDSFTAVVNVGKRPTVGGAHRTVEAHILGLDADIYGRDVVVEFVDRLRGEKRFESLDDLKAQIAMDVAAVNEIF